MVWQEDKILLGLRKGAQAAGKYSLPGGKLEYMESLANCAERELLEECGVRIKNIKFLYLANLTAYPPNHYAHIGLVAEWAGGEPQVLEPDMCESWGWHKLEEVPENIDKTLAMTLTSHQTGRNYFDA